MKRFLSTILSFCILFTNTGWALTAHYCMGERVGINLSHLTSNGDVHECDKCGMTKTSSSNGCCHDEEVVIKGAQDATAGVAYLQADLAVADLPVLGLNFPSENTRINPSKDKTPSQSHGPPGLWQVPLYLLNCVLLI